jgi:hypothetical protein
MFDVQSPNDLTRVTQTSAVLFVALPSVSKRLRPRVELAAKWDVMRGRPIRGSIYSLSGATRGGAKRASTTLSGRASPSQSHAAIWS